MLSIPTLSRQIIDSWPLAESGLPVRVVNSLAPEGVLTVGELRALPNDRLLSIRSLGRISIGHIHSFFLLCENLEKGKQAFADFLSVSAFLFDTDEWDVIQARYGLRSDDVVLKSHYTTLQKIGVAGHKTRERIRQIQEIALLKLKSRLATACLQPFFMDAVTFIRSHACIITGEDVTNLRGVAWLAGCNPAGTLVLFSELPASGFQYYNHCLSTLSIAALTAIEHEAVHIVEDRAAPMPLKEIVNILTPPPGLAGERQILNVVRCLLDHNKTIAATLEGDYFSFHTGIHPYLATLLGRIKRPVHYRAVMQNFNDRVKPLSRKGAGFILDNLNSHPQVTRVDRGVYDLKA